MSKISTLHDNIITKLGTLFPTHMRLENPYAIEENAGPKMQKAYGLRFGPARNTERSVGCALSVERTITVILTREYFATDMAGDLKATNEKTLLEDQYTLLNNIEQDTTLSGAVTKCVWDSDGGIQFQFNEERQFLYIENTFLCEYQQTYT